MPPKAMTQEMITQERNKILDCSVALIHDHGFESVTMRTIAKKLNSSATKIYKYFYNKDEILIAIAIESFKFITNTIENNISSENNPKEKLEIFLNSFMDFAHTHRNHYEMIFGDNAPNYRKYFGTELDEIAKEKLKAGHKFLEILRSILEEFIEYNNYEVNRSIDEIAMTLICVLHGTVVFDNNKLLSEVCQDVEQFKKTTIDRIVNRFDEVIM